MSSNVAYRRYFMYLLLSILTTVIGAIVGESFLIEFVYNLSTFGILAFTIIPLLLLMLSKGTMKQIMLYVFCFIEGVFLSPVLGFYTSTSLITALGLTIIDVIIFAFIGYKIRNKNINLLGKMLSMALISVLIYNVVGLFIVLPSINLIIMMVFSLYIVYDSHSFINAVNSRQLTNDEVIEFVINMYLNILNVFLAILDND